MEIYYYHKFRKNYKKLPEQVKLAAERKEQIFKKDPFDKRLKSHRLHGDLVEFFSFSVNKNYRIIFDFIGKNIARFYDIGTHDIYN